MPQESILGLLLFLVFINDIVEDLVLILDYLLMTPVCISLLTIPVLQPSNLILTSKKSIRGL